jgi:hypothetical protein
MFWIEALCVPEEPKARRKAIDSMSTIYSRVSATMIPDRSLENLNNKEFSLQEYYFFIRSLEARRHWKLPVLLSAQHVVLACGD